MAAKDYIQQGQFMRPGQIQGMVYDWAEMEAMGAQDMNEVWATKLKESQDPEHYSGGVYKSLEEGDWDESKPLEAIIESAALHEGDPAYEVYLKDGYHRVAAAMDIEKRTGREINIPINYEDRR